MWTELVCPDEKRVIGMNDGGCTTLRMHLTSWTIVNTIRNVHFMCFSTLKKMRKEDMCVSHRGKIKIYIINFLKKVI